MFNHNDSKISAYIADSAFAWNNTITQEDGFHIAVGFDPRYGAKENITDYLELSVWKFSGDYTGETRNETYTEINLHTCTDEDLNQFYQIKNSDKVQYSKLKASLMCFDHS